jgi:glutamine amidotransferase-like uncharacterized protein
VAQFVFIMILAIPLFSAFHSSLAPDIKPVNFPKISSAAQIEAHSKKRIALVYKGEGSCVEDCSESAALVAQLAGLTPVYISPNETNLDIFSEAAVWIQPGGESMIVADYLSPDIKRALREFIGNGGGYVGFCAGAFFADLWIHGTSSQGIDVMPARAYDYKKAPAYAAMMNLNWNGTIRSVYWEQGPYLELFVKGQIFHPFAFYPSGEIAGIYGHFYNGRVSVTGVHPEAPQYWRDDIKAGDPDGLDYDLAVDMVRWAAGI